MDERTGLLIEGHGRLDALAVAHARGDEPPDGIRKLKDGRWAMPVVRGWSSANDEEAARALIVLNRATELGGWLPELLHVAIGTLPDLELTGWSALDQLPPLAPFPAVGPVVAPYRPKRPPAASRRAEVRILPGDCVEVLASLEADSVDAVVCDPPYELGFMGKDWDASGVAYRPETWAAALRVLKPGGHLLAFGGSRTYHRMGVAIEDAGFEVRDSIHWIYGSGFPKSLDVSKAVDDKLGAEREVVGQSDHRSGIGNATAGHYTVGGTKAEHFDITAPGSPEGVRWEGWGTALKPAHEPIIVARKPLAGTVAENVLAYGTGGINVDGARVEAYITAGGEPYEGQTVTYATGLGVSKPQHEGGRWPPNVVLDESAAAELDRQSGVSKSPDQPVRQGGVEGYRPGEPKEGRARQDGWGVGYGDEGGASRFFPVFKYEAKASTAERNAGLEQQPEDDALANVHATVKPVELMRWLVRLVTPPGGVVLDPFAGSGTTLVAAVLEGFDAIGVELTAEYLPIIEGRVAWAHDQIGPLDL